MGAYDKAKYSRVEDPGDEDAGPSEKVAKKASAKILGYGPVTVVRVNNRHFSVLN